MGPESEDMNRHSEGLTLALQAHRLVETSLLLTA